MTKAQTVIWKMLLVAEKKFRRLKAPELMKSVYEGLKYVNQEVTIQVLSQGFGHGHGGLACL